MVKTFFTWGFSGRKIYVDIKKETKVGAGFYIERLVLEIVDMLIEVTFSFIIRWGLVRKESSRGFQ